MKRREPTAMEKANAIHGMYKFFADLGFTMEQANEWRQAGFHYPPCARDWRDAGFTAAEAAEWSAIGCERSNPVTAPEAQSAKKSGETAQTYRRNRNRTYPHPMQTR